MSRAAGQPTSVPVNVHKVVWFAPDRPVEGNTIYIRPATDVEPAAELDSPITDDVEA